MKPGAPSAGLDAEVLKLLCQMKEVQDVMGKLEVSCGSLVESFDALEANLAQQSQKITAVESVLSRMNASKPKAPPPHMPAPEVLGGEPPLPPPPNQPPGQWNSPLPQTLPQAQQGAIPKMGGAVPLGSFPGPVLQMPSQGTTQPPLQGFMGIGVTAPTNEMITVLWEGKPFQMPAGLAQQMHLQPAPSQI